MLPAGAIATTESAHRTKLDPAAAGVPPCPMVLQGVVALEGRRVPLVPQETGMQRQTLGSLAETQAVIRTARTGTAISPAPMVRAVNPA
jgi:hypothetical protein